MADMKSIQGIVIVLVIIGLVLGIGFLLMEEFEDTLGTTSGSAINETITSSNTTCVYVTANYSTATLGCYNTFAVSEITNATGGEIITAGNYTAEAGKGCITGATDGGVGLYIDEDWNVTYTYQFSNSSDACDGIDETITATATIPTWLTIIVIVLIVGIILFLVFRFVPKLATGTVTGAEGTIAQV